MHSSLNRRSFLKRSALAAGALSATRIFPVPNILAADSPGKKLNCALVGCGGRAMNHLEWLVTESKAIPERSRLRPGQDPGVHRLP